MCTSSVYEWATLPTLLDKGQDHNVKVIISTGNCHLYMNVEHKTGRVLKGEAATLNAEDNGQPVRFREALRAIYIQGKEMKLILPNLQMKRGIQARVQARLAMRNKVENQKSRRYDLQEGGGYDGVMSKKGEE